MKDRQIDKQADALQGTCRALTSYIGRYVFILLVKYSLYMPDSRCQMPDYQIISMA